jgi:hypothetical protein
VPDLEYALLCDYVRPEGAFSHVLAANVDTLHAPAVPAAHNLGILIVEKFDQEECDRAHVVYARFRSPSGEQLVEVRAEITPQWQEGVPPGWKITGNIALNVGLPLPEYGLYTLEIALADSRVQKTLNLRVVQPPPPP